MRALIRANGIVGGTYVEPFAGAAGLAWALLLDGTVSRVILNDLDPALYAFWRAVFRSTDDLCRMIRATHVNMATWRTQKRVLESVSSYTVLSIAYAAFFLNRTNRSGVLRGGVIGGKRQIGEWRMDARFNTDDLIRRIRRIAQYRSSVRISRMDATTFLRRIGPTLPSKTLVFIDPPYFSRGDDLYLNTYEASHHQTLSSVVKSTLECPWAVSYDDVPAVRRLYHGYKSRSYQMSYSAARRYSGGEVLFFSKGLSLPRGRLPAVPIPLVSA